MLKRNRSGFILARSIGALRDCIDCIHQARLYRHDDEFKEELNKALDQARILFHQLERLRVIAIKHRKHGTQ